MLSSLKTAISGTIIVLSINGAYGGTTKCTSNEKPLQDSAGDNAHYFLNRDKVPNFNGLMGDLFFALEKTKYKVHIGKYNGSCWTKDSGWVDKKYLIEGLRPLRVDQAAKQFPQLTKEPGVKADSKLWLRALQKPEYHKEKPLTAPDRKNALKKDIGLEGLAYRWRHVYAIEYIENKLWYLVGSQSKLFSQPKKNTTVPLDKKVLLGWVPAKANQLLATNIGLELNSSKAAVDERLNKNKPVILYQKPRTDSKVLSEEDLEVWNDYKSGKKTAGTMAWIEPDGFDPNYPRFYIHDYNSTTGWYHVSTWGSISDKLKPSDITRLARKIQDTLDRLRTVDIVVVLDKSGSMYDEIQALKQWLIDFSKELANIKAGNTSKLNFFGKDEDFTVGLKIKLSLVLFEAKQDYPIFKRAKLPLELTQVIKGIDSISLTGGYETMFDTLTRVLPANSGYWEEGGFSQRFILLFTDEPGDVGDYKEYDVKNAMPLPKKELTKMGYDPKTIPATEWTKIFGIHTEKYCYHDGVYKNCYNEFKNNVDSFIDKKRLIHIDNFENSPNQAERFKIELLQMMKEFENEIKGRAKRLSNLLIQDYEIKQQGGSRRTNVNIPATMKLRDVAIQAALTNSGTSINELSAMVGVAFVNGYISTSQDNQFFNIDASERKQLEHRIFGIASNINKFFKQNTPNDKIAETLLYAILATAGDQGTLDYLTNLNPKKKKLIINNWLQKQQNSSIAEILEMNTAIKNSKVLLLNKPIKDIINMDANSIRNKANNLLQNYNCIIRKCSKEESKPLVKEVVVLEVNELRTLHNQVNSIAQRIISFFKPKILSNTLADIKNKVGSSLEDQIAASLLYAILATTGQESVLNHIAKMEPIELIKLIRNFLKENAKNNIAVMIGMQTSIETNSKGLLNRPLKEIVKMDLDTIRYEARIMLQKSHCMNKILYGKTIPMEIENCSKEQGIHKRWKYEQNNENYIYVPIRVIP